MPRVTVTVNLYKLRKFASVLESDLRLSTNGPVREALHDWATIYGRFLTKRYETFSQGGGNWRALSPKTLMSKAARGLLLLILRATDVMFEAFAPGFSRKPGAVGEMPFGVRVEFSGGMQRTHPNSDKTIAEIAMFHQLGGPHLPQRKILVPPDQETIKAMRDRMERGMKELTVDAGYAA